VSDIAGFITARLDEEERTAREAFEEGMRWIVGLPDPTHGEDAVWRTRGLDAVDRCSEHDSGMPNECDDAIVAVFDDFHGVQSKANAAHVVAQQPVGVLADIAAKRRIVGLCSPPLIETTGPWSAGREFTRGGSAPWADPVLRLLALKWAEHDDYKEMYRP
jgi:hypothetical protein